MLWASLTNSAAHRGVFSKFCNVLYTKYTEDFLDYWNLYLNTEIVCHSVCWMANNHWLGYTSSVKYFCVCCTEVLQIAEAVGHFKKIGSFARMFCKLTFKLENENNHWPMLNSAKFCGNGQIPWLGLRKAVVHTPQTQQLQNTHSCNNKYFKNVFAIATRCWQWNYEKSAGLCHIIKRPLIGPATKHFKTVGDFTFWLGL